MKNYIITKKQFNFLLEHKRNEKRVVEEIMNKFDKIKKNLNESIHENSMISLLKPYYKKGKINKNVADSLIKNGVNKNILVLARDKM